MAKPFRLSARVKSVRHALAGIAHMIRTQHNAWIHLAATGAVLAAALILRLSAAEWTAIVLAIVLVWTAEAINTAFELLCDVASPEIHPLVEKAKDVAAGAVLVSAAGAVVVGVLAFWRHL